MQHESAKSKEWQLQKVHAQLGSIETCLYLYQEIYDFYLPEYNTFIEIDGDFWHCNPDTKFAIPECKSQKLNLINDQFKNKWVTDNGYKMLRFWENDINNNISIVKEILLENCPPF